MVPPASDRVPRVRPYSGAISVRIHFNYRAFTSYGCAFQYYSSMDISSFVMVRNPICKQMVWPLSRSLAATRKIVFTFSSYGYLDVSVPRVPFLELCIHSRIHTHCRMWVPPFGHLRVYGYVLLTAAFRSLSRPSSAPSAKASP